VGSEPAKGSWRGYPSIIKPPLASRYEAHLERAAAAKPRNKVITILTTLIPTPPPPQGYHYLKTITFRI
jgi:hypothetical protein